MSPDELGAASDVLELLAQVLDGVYPASPVGVPESITRLAIAKTFARGLAGELRVDAGYHESLPDAPLRDLRKRAARLRDELAILSAPVPS